MEKKHIAVYVRVSTVRQTTASQLAELENWAKAQEKPVRWYEDKASWQN